MSINFPSRHSNEIKLLLNDSSIRVLGLNETKLDDSIPKELTDLYLLIEPVMEVVSHFMFETPSK